MSLRELLFGKPKKEEKRSDGDLSGGELAELIRAIHNGDFYISANEALQISAVSRCVNMISAAVGMLPVKLYRKAEDGAVEIKDDIRVKILNGDTGDTLNATEMRTMWARDYLLHGRAYGYIIKRNAVADRLYYVAPRDVVVTSDVDPIFKKYSLTVNGKIYHPDYFLKILRHSDGKGKGFGVIDENKELLSTAYVTMKLEKNFAANGGNKKGFLHIKNRVEKQAEETLRNEWRELYSGKNTTPVLFGDVDFKELSSSAEQLQINERTASLAQSIMAVFGTNDGILSDETVHNAVMPVLDAFEAAFDSELLLESEKGDYYFAFDTREITRGNTLERYNAYAVALQNNFMQLDDVRLLEDLPPLGFKYIKLGLQDVLLDPAKNIIYVPNTNAFSDLGNGVPLGEVRARGDNYIKDEKGRFAGSTPGAGSSGGTSSGKSEKSVDKSEICDKIKSELKSTCFIGEVHYPPKEIDISSLSFDNEHINTKRGHNVTENEAKTYIKNAKISVTKENPDGIFENYFGEKGAAYVHIKSNTIRTSYSASQFNNGTKRLLETIRKCEKNQGD